MKGTKQFLNIYELGKQIGRLEERGRIMDLVREASLDGADFVESNQTGSYIYLSDLRDYLGMNNEQD